MALLRPLKDKRSASVNEYTCVSRPTQRIPTPFLRHESVVEEMEKKQREGLKNRLKMLHTTVLPSRTVVTTNLPVIVKAPARTVALPKIPEKKVHYQSVLTWTSDSVTASEGEQSRKTRRHSVGSFNCTYRQERTSPSEINGNNFKIGNFHTNKFSGNKDKTISADNKLNGVPNFEAKATILSTNESHSNKESLAITSKLTEITTSPVMEEKFKETRNIGANINGNCMKTNDDDEVFSSPNNKGKLEFDENLNFEQRDNDGVLKVNTEKPDIDHELSGHQNDPEKPGRSGPDVVEIPETVSQTKSESLKATEEIWNTELHHGSNGETPDNEDKSLLSSLSTNLDSSVLIILDDSVNMTSSLSPSHSSDPLETDLENSEQHKQTTTKLTPYPDIINSCQGETEACTIFEKVEDDKKLEESSALHNGCQNAKENALNENEEPKFIELDTNGKHDFSNKSKELDKNNDKNDDKNNDEADAFWSAVEGSITGLAETTSGKPRSEPIEVEVEKCPDSGLGFCIEGGKDSPHGDRPIKVKRIFHATTTVAQKCLKEGDEILTVAGEALSNMTHFHAWALLKSLPVGPVKMTIIRREEEH